jgi:hypothetical protein
MQLQTIQTNSNTVFIPYKAHKQNLPLHQHKVCAPICNISHTVSTILHCGPEKRSVQNIQSAPCSSSSSVKLSVRGTASSVSKSDGVSDGVGSRQTLLFCLFEGPRRAFNTSHQGLDLVACLIFFSELPHYNKLYFLCCLFQQDDLDLVHVCHRAAI